MSTLTKPMLIAHRGASKDAPENSLAAFALAWQQGADGIEADFRLTRDGRIVCLHDATTGRTATVDLVAADSTFDELCRLDIGARKGSSWQGERIPSLEEVLEQQPPGKMIFIELKSGPEIIPPLRQILAMDSVPPDQLRLLAFDRQLVARLKKELPGYRVCLNVEYHRSLHRLAWSPSKEELLTILGNSGADGLSSQAHPLLDAPFIAALRSSGKEIHVWTVDTVRRADHYRHLGVDSVMTNRPGWLRSRLPPQVP